MTRTSRCAPLVALLVLITACKDEGARAALDSARTMSENAARKLGDLASKGKDAVVAAAKDQAADLDLVIGDLKQAAAKTSGEAKVKIEEQLRSLEADRAALATKMEPLVESAGEGWKDVAREIDAIVMRMRTTIADVRAKLKGG
jgi:hypothetical protein